MDTARHHLLMGTILILLIAAIGPLAIYFGADSRIDEPAWQQRWRDLA